MVNNISPAGNAQGTTGQVASIPRLMPKDLRTNATQDSAQFGRSGPLNNSQAMGIVLERAYEKLQGVVNQARGELGIPEGAIIDTSPEATADRIVSFALGFFDKYAKNNKLENDEAGRAQFAAFIGGAINQGISEARDILGALNSLSKDVTSNINKTADIIQQRLNDFVKNSLSSTSPTSAV